MSEKARQKFQPIIDQIKDAKDPNDKIDTLATMVFIMATNDLTCIERQIKTIYVGLGAIGAVLLIQNPKVITDIVGILAKIF